MQVKEQVLYLLLGSAGAWLSIRVCAVGLPFKEPTPKVELLCVLLVQVVICFVILERKALQAVINPLVTPLIDPPYVSGDLPSGQLVGPGSVML